MDELWKTDDEDLLVAVAAVQERIKRESASLVALVAEVATRGLAGAKGFRDTADLLRTVQNVGASTARARVDAARKLSPLFLITGDQVDPELPVLAEAFEQGAVTPEHVRVIIRVLASLPPHLGEHRPVLEADLVAHAGTLDPDAVDTLGRRAVALLDPDGPRPREPKPTRNRLALRPQGSGFEARGWLDTESAAVLRSALSPLTAPVPPDGAGQARDERSTAERNGDGLVELARRLLAVGDLGVENGLPVALTVTVPLETLTSGAGAGLLGFGAGGLSAAIAAQGALRLACDARVVPIVLASTGEPLFVGRESRLANRAQRRALAQRDGGCAFPGCEAPPQWCVAHHVVHWAHGGCTDLTNLVLLCPHHHRMIHIGDWAVEIDGGFPVFHPPPWVPGGPRRNPLHRPDLPVPRSPRHSAPVLLDAVLASS
ncbi:HNH endonuclease signature motif containing protein [Pseudonocardia sp. McavD-2-B]|uniref:HNH endonuclease signature motif containing protein n=1 Tax=Pseudonocardia sp. McavD-2-B TaxID=2954499 RepID=UPI002096C9F6|nr:HNH endonuclease signature motif containing protein [Pseudonocardia sp. McavD-2-B]MCO7194364.1 HNH endonuclease [Pseudonocardia sp. McavD-2-B]